MEQALTGYKVLDFGHYIAGPYAAMLLAEQGAEVIHFVTIRDLWFGTVVKKVSFSI